MKTYPFHISPMIKICAQAIFVMAVLAACKKNRHETRPVISTVAGGRRDGFADGIASYALFSMPGSVATDAQGNIYVADTWNHRIRIITTTGIVSTFAGTGVQGLINGPGPDASFNFPEGVACDAQGNVYVAELANNVIRKITPGGIVSTYAGTGAAGQVDGPAATARFSSPTGVACDAQGNVYVADQGRDLIRKITPAGMVSTLAGSTNGYADGTGSAAKFFGPYAVACDNHGNVYVADRLNNRIRKITQAGVVTTLAGSTNGYADGTGAAAQFNQPSGIACDSHGDIYVADSYSHKIRKVTPAGVVTTYAGSTAGFADGEAVSALFNLPYGICFDSHDNMYISDYLNARIRKITLQ